jgi:hypothetical protein
MDQQIDARTQRELEHAITAVAERLEQQVDRLACVFAGVFSSNEAKSQVSNLERTGLTALRLGDVITYVKRQTGKDSKGRNWSQPVEGSCIGVRLVAFLEDLRSQADQECEKRKITPLRNEARLRLAGICLRNLNSSYLYHSVVGEGGAGRG